MKPVWQLVQWSTILLAGFFLSQDMCLWSAPKFLHYPSIFVLFAGGIAIFAFLAAIPFSLSFAARGLMNWRDRPTALSHLGRMVVCILFAITFVAVLRWTSMRRTAAFTRASANGAPIVAALKTYRTNNGEYPDSLQQLVPECVPALPWTGLIGYPNFTYRKGYNDISAVPDSYELRINCSSGGINFDRFIYWPSETYPKQIQGNGTELIGRWVYVHE